MHKSKRKKGDMVLKIDLHKAYDSVDWTFLKQTLLEFGFPEMVINLIMYCVTSASLSLVWNGVRLDSFTPTRGLRQGDPLSPYLFVLCMEKLSSLISKKVEDGHWKPVSIWRGGLKISHLFFAADILLFARAKVSQIAVIMQVLNDFAEASGLRMNTAKSKALASKSIARSKKERLESTSGISFTGSLGKYLGFNIIQGRVKREHFNSLLDRLKSKLSAWRGKLLNKAGRVTLAKAVITTIPSYVMQSVCDDLDCLVRNFIWSRDGGTRGLNLVNWKTVSMHHSWGGLGIRQARISNIASLGKLVWTMLAPSNKLWTHLLREKYQFNGIWLDGSNYSNASTIWRTIVKVGKLLKDGFHLKLGCGEASFWYESWLHDGPLCKDVPYVHISDSDLKVKDIWDMGTWRLERIYTPLNPNVLQRIQDSRIWLHPSSEDCWAWMYESSGSYTISSGYWWIYRRMFEVPTSQSWNWVWRLPTTEKCRFLVWLALHNAVPTNSLCHHRGLSATPYCNCCCDQEETILHCLRDCRHAKDVWAHFAIPDDFFLANDVKLWLASFY